MSINDLLKLAVDGDKKAENQLFEELSARFLLITRHKVENQQDCEEIVQKALTVILEQFKNIKFEVSFAAWAKKVLDHRIIDYYRSKKRHQNRITGFVEDSVSTGRRELDPIFKKKLLDCLKKVNAHNKQHSRMLVLKYLGYSFDEICIKLGLTRNNSYSVLSRARSMLEICLKKGDIYK